MKTINKIITLAEQEIGYIEKKTNSNLDSKLQNVGDGNFTKYARDLDNIKYFNNSKNGYPWCAVFFNWLLVNVYGKDMALNITNQPTKNNYGAGCTESMTYYKKNNQFYTYPKIGDQIFFGKTNLTSYHTGIVINITPTNVTTIEGNTSNKSGVVDNGGMVCKKSYNLNNSVIVGYGRPLYKDIETENTEMIEKKTYFIDGKKLTINTILKDGSNYVELRTTADALGYNINYDETTKIVSLTKIIDVIKMKINGTIKNVNRILISNNNFIKLRDLEDDKIDIGYLEDENLATLDIK